jgi:hypothetical protein
LPYIDSVEPFLAFENKHTIMLALTSNEGAFDFQTLSRRKDTSTYWKHLKLEEFRESDVGATKAEYFTEIVPDSLLVPEHRRKSSEVCVNANGIADKFITRNHICFKR